MAKRWFILSKRCTCSKPVVTALILEGKNNFRHKLHRLHKVVTALILEGKNNKTGKQNFMKEL